jgi:diguanylate cyclase (GGDEF)-like protein/PAS domain S-box-containing protein
MFRAPALRTVLFALFGMVATLPVLILALGVERPALERELAEVDEKHLLLARSMAGTLDRYAQDVAAVFDYIATRLEGGGDDFGLSPLMESLHLRRVEILTEDGSVQAAVDRYPGGSSELSPAERRELLQRALRKQVSFSPVAIGADGYPVVYLSRRLSSGVVAVGVLDTALIQTVQAELVFGEHGHAAVVDQTGHILAHPRPDWVLEVRDISRLKPVLYIREHGSGVVRFVSPALGQEMVTGFASVPSTGWGAMVPQPVSELVSNAEGLVGSALKFAALAAVIAALIGWWLAGRITRPVAAVVAAASHGAGRSSVVAPGPGRWAPREMRALIESFNGMTDEVRANRRALEHSEARFRDFAEAAADWFWETDPALNLRYLSGRFVSGTGLAESQALGQPLAGLLGARVMDESGGEILRSALEAKESFEEIPVIWESAGRESRVHRVCGRPLFDDQGHFVGYRGTGRDATEAHALTQQLNHQASHDDLTGLVNRREFERRLRRVLQTTQIDDSDHALCYLDLDQFKVVNDTCGHIAGDELLRRLAVVLRHHLRRRDTLARLGGDEFGILLEHCSLERASELGQNLCAALNDYRFSWEESSFRLSASIGLVPIGHFSGGINEVLGRADAACYAAKEGGGNRVQVYHADDLEQVRRSGEMRWVPRLQDALEQGGFELYSQELKPLALSGGARCIELLLRLREGSGELVCAGRFFPAAERFNLAPQLDRMVVTRALAWFGERPLLVQSLGFCAINLSGASLADPGFRHFVVKAVIDGGIPPEKLCFEITETAAIVSLPRALELMGDLKRLGCRFALDDFGTGLSSFAYLKRLPVDILKIDGAFVRDMLHEPVDLAMVRSINELSHLAGKQTVAESVESADMLAPLVEIGVDFAQGYGVSRPQPLDALVA